jgi:hypothetical protein
VWGNNSPGNPAFLAPTEEIMETGNYCTVGNSREFFAPFCMYVLDTQDYQNIHRQAGGKTSAHILKITGSEIDGIHLEYLLF